MAKTDKLLAKYLARDTTAFDELVALREAAVPPLIAALEKARGVPQLTTLLAALRLDDPVAVLAPFADHPSDSVQYGVLHALGSSGDPRALPVLEKTLRMSPISTANALGLLGDPNAIPLLLARVYSYVADGRQIPPADWLRSGSRCLDLQIVLAVTSALAKLGDTTLAPIAIHVVNLRDAQEIADANHVRVSAIGALSFVTTPGVAGALHRAAADPDRDVGPFALEGLLLLGRTDEVESWLAALGGTNARTALACLEAWSGEHPTGEPRTPVAESTARAWWTTIASRFTTGTSYRLGKPADPGDLVARLASDPAAQSELATKTGARVIHETWGELLSAGEIAATETWWKANASRFPPGKLHRWGRTYDPGAVD